MRVRSAAAASAIAVAVAGCGHGAAGDRAPLPVVSARPAAPATPATPVAARQAVPPPVGRSQVRQLVVVSAVSRRATYADLTAYRLVSGRWRRVFGPWTARIGRAGFASAGRKREGDGRTPSGTYGFGFFFGVEANPGVAFAYRRSQPSDFWDDDPSSPRYNEWVDERRADPGANPEPMDVSGYDYGAVIAYNTARAPGLGSAIFLHVNIGTATTGCITLPVGELLTVLRWLRPAQSPRIELGVGVAPPGG